MYVRVLIRLIPFVPHYKLYAMLLFKGFVEFVEQAGRYLDKAAQSEAWVSHHKLKSI